LWWLIREIEHGELAENLARFVVPSECGVQRVREEADRYLASVLRLNLSAPRVDPLLREADAYEFAGFGAITDSVARVIESISGSEVIASIVEAIPIPVIGEHAMRDVEDEPLHLKRSALSVDDDIRLRIPCASRTHRNPVMRHHKVIVVVIDDRAKSPSQRDKSAHA
jgi:hypothetical protein